MAHVNGDDSLAREDLAGSAEALLTTVTPRGSSNSRAIKIAGLTTLAVLLVCSQVFMAYMVLDQKEQIRMLKISSDKMARVLGRPAPAFSPLKMAIPMNTLPLTMDWSADTDTKDTKAPEAPQTAVANLKQELKALTEDFKLPEFNETFMGNLQSLRQKMNSSDWKNLESWMQQWLVFQMAQRQKPAPVEPKPAPEIKTKCQLESEPRAGKLGSFRPQCDEQGRYQTIQCWRSTGYCWCVDETGAARKDTTTFGKPDCDKVPAPSPTPELIID